MEKSFTSRLLKAFSEAEAFPGYVEGSEIIQWLGLPGEVFVRVAHRETNVETIKLATKATKVAV